MELGVLKTPLVAVKILRTKRMVSVIPAYTEPWLKNGKETKRDMIAEMIPEISDLLVFRVGSLPLLV